MAPRLLLATNNQGKQRELCELLADCGWEFVVPSDLGLRFVPEETGSTYAENATIKAVAGALMSGLPSLADDSGLEVAALGGRPGLHSARYGGDGASDADRRVRLLQEMRGIAEGQRAAAFVCVIAIAVPQRGDTSVTLCEGRCEGRIVLAERGGQGFGYDPIFLLPELGRTMAELSPEEKGAISHRGRAAREAVRVLKAMAGQGEDE